MQFFRITISILFLGLVTLLQGAALLAQDQPAYQPYVSQQTIRPVDLSMHLEPPQVQGDAVLVNYDLPYGGMVELKLFDAERNMLWRNQYINTDGKNRIRFRANILSAGEYTIWLFYKGRSEEMSFVIPQS